MSKIFMAFFAGNDYGNTHSVLPPFYESFISELSARNHKLYVVPHDIFSDHNWSEVTLDIEKEILEFNPDLCIIFNNAFYDISRVVSCPILIYSADSVLYYANKNSIKNNPSR